MVTRRVWDCSLAAGGAKAAKALCRDEDVDDRGAGGDVLLFCALCVCVCVCSEVSASWPLRAVAVLNLKGGFHFASFIYYYNLVAFL